MKTFAEYLEAKGTTNKSIAIHSKHLSYFLAWTGKENITPEKASYNELISYIKHLKTKSGKKIKQRTVQLYINTLTHYFDFQIKREKRIDNPTRNIVIKGVQRKYLYDILNKAELESLYEDFENPDENHKDKNQNWFKTSLLTAYRNKTILGLMIYQGLGSSDLGRLTLKDLRLREGKINIPGSLKSNERELKLQAVQVLDIMEYVMQTRKELLALTEKTSDNLFVSTGTSDKFSNIITGLIKKLHKQTPKVTSIKQIRASVITGWLKTYNLRETQYMAGHRYVGSTESYLINDLEGLAEDVSKYHPIG